MQNLATKLTVYTGIEEKQAKAVLLIIAAHVKENFPILRGYTDSLFDIEELFITQGRARTRSRTARLGDRQ